MKDREKISLRGRRRAEPGVRARTAGLDRAWINRVLDLACLLPDADRALLEQIYRRGASVSELAVLAGTDRGLLARRVRRLVARLRDPRFAFYARHHADLPPPIARTAQLVLTRELSLRHAAKVSGQSLHRIRQHMTHVAALAQVA